MGESPPGPPPLIQEFDAIGNRPQAAEAAFWTGYCHEKLDDITTKARVFYDLAVKQYPDTPAARQAVDLLAGVEAGVIGAVSGDYWNRSTEVAEGLDAERNMGYISLGK